MPPSPLSTGIVAIATITKLAVTASVPRIFPLAFLVSLRSLLAKAIAVTGLLSKSLTFGVRDWD